MTFALHNIKFSSFPEVHSFQLKRDAEILGLGISRLNAKVIYSRTRTSAESLEIIRLRNSDYFEVSRKRWENFGAETFCLGPSAKDQGIT